jgi:succinate dehydrogenase/fumarate reductase flavoprotein subunit
MEIDVSRRSFLAASGAGALGVVIGSSTRLAYSSETQTKDESHKDVSGQATSSTQGPHTFADTIAWNAEYDVVVIGFGGAGAQASIYAADAGAKVLVCEKAPKGDEGGNTRYCDQCILAANDAERMYNYIIDLCGTIDHDDNAIRAFSEGLAEIPEDLAYLGIDNPVKWSENPEMDSQFPGLMPEYPDSPYGDAVEIYTVNRVISDSALWKALKRNVYKRSDSISVWLDSPATHLIKDPTSGTIVGVEIKKQGENVLVRANNGVILACGGYEANDTMLQNFIGATHYAIEGTFYNTGDGIKMAQEVGADLWHVGNFASYGTPYAGLTVKVSGQERIDYSLRLPTSGSLFIASDDGSRYLREDGKEVHGRLYANGKWRIPFQMEHPHLIFDSTELDEIKNLGLDMDKLEKQMVSADTVEELATLIEADPDILSNQIDAFNHFAQEGIDYQFGRSPESMRAFDGGALYAVAYSSFLTNTQGGPRRNADAQVVDTNGAPIPHLYSAGVSIRGFAQARYSL